MNAFNTHELRIVLVRPGETELDGQARISGNLDVSLSQHGQEQVMGLAELFRDWTIAKIYTGPNTASRETADLLSATKKIKIKVDDRLRNLDCGLWHGKRIQELKETQPRIFKLWQEQPHAVCPPNGESIEEAKVRLESFAKKMTKKSRQETLLVVAAEPVACLLRSELESTDFTRYWTTEPNCGTWLEVICRWSPVAK